MKAIGQRLIQDDDYDVIGNIIGIFSVGTGDLTTDTISNSENKWHKMEEFRQFSFNVVRNSHARYAVYVMMRNMNQTDYTPYCATIYSRHVVRMSVCLERLNETGFNLYAFGTAEQITSKYYIFKHEPVIIFRIFFLGFVIEIDKIKLRLPHHKIEGISSNPSTINFTLAFSSEDYANRSVHYIFHKNVANLNPYSLFNMSKSNIEAMEQERLQKLGRQVMSIPILLICLTTSMIILTTLTIASVCKNKSESKRSLEVLKQMKKELKDLAKLARGEIEIKDTVSKMAFSLPTTPQKSEYTSIQKTQGSRMQKIKSIEKKSEEK
ncbi:unnamed protein product [Bursaphelenchus okinawaensis]|uniref:Uncharacterized protein n=1 Tax=Bursaphelenchus okinawaensis TaxID=465554 RepID=A0A811K1X9_9BILA|nr:unnamed protein product [Bursaphelenchus okinawaensis]CAG9090358.1 unnamed protein product [Bursaphelenchus okinawaensis]